MHLFGACPNEPALKWSCSGILFGVSCSGSSRSAPVRDLAPKNRCTLKKHIPADRW